MEALCWGVKKKRLLDEWRPVKGYVVYHDHVDRAQVGKGSTAVTQEGSLSCGSATEPRGATEADPWIGKNSSPEHFETEATRRRVFIHINP